MCVFDPDRPRESAGHGHQVADEVEDGNHFGEDLDYHAFWAYLVDCCEEHVEVEGRSGVGGGEGEQGDQHGEVEADVFVAEGVFGVHDVEVVVLEHVKKGEQTAVNPSPALLHQILVGLHGVGLGNGVGDVLEIVLLLGLAVDAQAENPVLGEIHVGLPVVLFLHLGVEDHLEVAVLEEVGLVGLGLDEGFVAVGGPGAGEHVEET